MNGIEKRMLLQTAAWIAVSISISIGINFALYALLGERSMIVSIVVVMGVFIAINYFIIRRRFRNGGGQMFGGISGSRKYRCSNCGEEYKGSSCPKCKFKGGRVIFE